MLRLAAAAMAKNDEADGERGVIVNTASVAAFDGQIGQAAYSCFQGRRRRHDPARRPRPREPEDPCRHHRPGSVPTPRCSPGCPQAAQDSLGAQVPHPSRLGDPDEYAALAEHIVANPMLNGEVIRLDGAIRMAPR